MKTVHRSDAAEIVAGVRYYLKRIAIDDKGCWNWTGSYINGSNPQANIVIRGVAVQGSARRIIMGLSEDDRGLVVSACENGRCVNPEHLRVVKSARKARILPKIMDTGHSRFQPSLTDEQKQRALKLLDAGLTQKQTAELLGVSASTISRISRAKT